MLAGVGGPLTNAFGTLLLRYLPALESALRAARSPADVRAALDGSRDAIRTLVRQEVQLRALVTGATDAMAGKLAARFGIEPAEARRRFGYFTVLSDRMNDLKDAIMRGTHPGCREPGFSPEAEAEGVMNRLVEEYVAKLVLVDGLQGVDDETREALRVVIRRESRPDKPFIDVRRAQRIAAKADGAALLAALVRELAIGANPGLKAALERLSADPFAFRAAVHFQQPEHQDHPLRATVASTLF